MTKMHHLFSIKARRLGLLLAFGGLSQLSFADSQPQFSIRAVVATHPEAYASLPEGQKTAERPTEELLLEAPARPTLVDLNHNSGDVWNDIRQGFAIPEVNHKLVQEEERRLKDGTRGVHAMLVRSRPFIYFIAAECQKRGLPTELALIPFVESQFNPTARSPRAAEGLWQFIPSTGRQYDLTQNHKIDERRDLIASTRAALDYFTNLYEMHGDWHLAIASYNVGEGAVLRAVKSAKARGKTPSFKNLNLPEETRRYLPRLQAFKNLILNPERFDVVLPEVPNRPYFTKVRYQGEIDLRDLARKADVDIDTIRKLNSGVKHPVMRAPQGGGTLLVPNYHLHSVQNTLGSQIVSETDGEPNTLESAKSNAKSGITGSSPNVSNPASTPITQLDGLGVNAPIEWARIESLSSDAPTVSETLRVHFVRKGETLAHVANQYDTTVDALRRLNRNLEHKTLKPGTIVRVS